MAFEQVNYGTPERAASRNAMPLLMIFIDGFPHHLLGEENFYISQLKTMAPLQPGFGFSVNIFAELYAGLTPDDVGYLNIWVLDQPDHPAYTEVNIGPLKRATQRMVDRMTRRPQALSRFIHKVYERIAREGNVGNIPFTYLPFFRRGASSRPISYIFDELGMKVFRHEKIAGSILERDQLAFLQALDTIKRGASVFVTFGSLDHAGHLVGPSSSKFVERARLLDSWCQELIESFLATHSRTGYVIICSDHGLADVHTGVSVDLEREFGKPGHTTYWYFLDSTMARIWVKDPQLLGEIVEFLQHQPDGTVLDVVKRAAHGISNNAFMNVVFVLDEGKVLWPNWTGGWFPKGMHGYLPEEPSQQGIFIFHDPKEEREHPLPLPTRTREVYQFLRKIVG